MNILQVISYLYPAYSFGGPGVLVFDLSQKLTKNGHNVTICSTDAFDKERRRNRTDNEIFKKLDIKTYFFKNLSNFLAYHFKLFLPLNFLPVFIKEISKFDVIHIHEFFTPMAALISLTLPIHKVPIFISAHGTLDKFHFSHRLLLKKIFMSFFGNLIIKNASLFVAATEEEENEYQELGIPKEKIAVVKNGIDLENFKISFGKGQFREKWGIYKYEKVILYVGRIHKLKGLDLLIDSFSKMVREIKTKLVIIGSDDGYLSELKRKIDEDDISDKVIFTGVMFGDDKLIAYQDADIFVYPSPSEGFSIAILEAASCGLPLVITKGCKFPEVEKYKAGIIVETKSDEIYLALKKLIKNNDFRAQAGLNAKRLVEENYHISIMAEKLEKIYKQFSNK